MNLNRVDSFAASLGVEEVIYLLDDDLLNLKSIILTEKNIFVKMKISSRI